MIQVIVSYMGAFLVKSENTLHTFRKGRDFNSTIPRARQNMRPGRHYSYL